MFHGYRETAAQIEARWQRILAKTPAPIYPPLPTLAECLEMVDDIELVRRAAARSGRSYKQLVDELRAEVAHR